MRIIKIVAFLIINYITFFTSKFTVNVYKKNESSNQYTKNAASFWYARNFTHTIKLKLVIAQFYIKWKSALKLISIFCQSCKMPQMKLILFRAPYPITFTVHLSSNTSFCSVYLKHILIQKWCKLSKRPHAKYTAEPQKHFHYLDSSLECPRNYI